MLLVPVFKLNVPYLPTDIVSTLVYTIKVPKLQGKWICCNDSVCTVCTSTTQAVRCYSFIGCKATGGTDNGYIYKCGEYWLGDAHFGGLTTAHAWRLFSTATSLPLDFWSLDQKSIQDKTMGNKNKKGSRK